MLTLLVLIHKSADELNSVKKELVHCKQKHELASTQLQNAIDYKLRLEQSLENEKTKDKQHADEMQSKLSLEQEERRKEKEDLKKEKDDANSRYENLKHELENLKAENQDLKDENSKLTSQLEQAQSEKDREIEKLKVDLVQSGSKPTTPGINPQALVEHEEAKQVGPPPNNGHNAGAEDMMRKSLDLRSGDDMKMDENVIKAPSVKSDKKEDDQFMGDDKRDAEQDLQNDNIFKNQQGNLPLPYLNMGKPKASSASNNAAERPVEDQGDILPAPVLHPPGEEKEKQAPEIPKHINYQNDEEDDEYVEKNEIPDKPVPKKDGKFNFSLLNLFSCR
ncbi:hypothetical protein V9T40_000348 [Parthenolecanium corni]|uniref:Golgi integral membrane protein 4 n=1 Tax=Parthenolecanium corni TaxID=536013 RepID=A0AAN9Y0E7_9HEMI